MEVPDDDEQRL